MLFQELFSELKRRRVFRVAGIYVVGAFAALQDAQLLIESLKMPALDLDRSHGGGADCVKFQEFVRKLKL